MIEDRVIVFGPFELRVGERQLLRGGSRVDLGGRGMDLLIALLETPGEVVEQKRLLDRAWPNRTVGEGSLRVAISTIRRALGEGQHGDRFIANVSGRGYCFVAPVQQLGHLTTVSDPAPTASLLGPLPRLTALPAPRRMIGRDRLLGSLTQRLKESRFVSLIGPGGMGKTTVAISAAHAFVRSARLDVCFVDLATITEEHLVPVAVATALGASTQTDELLPSIVSSLAGRHALLVLDNCEHVIDAAANLAELLYLRTPNTHLLVTSREALRVEGEQIQVLTPLPFPNEDDVVGAANAPDWPAVELFVERAMASGYRDFSDADIALIGTICRRLDGIALAIELAASRVGSIGLKGVMDLLDNRFGLLWRGRRSALPRHHTLHDMIDWSFNLLTEPEKRTFIQLGVLVGPFTLDAAKGIIDTTDGGETAVAEKLSGLVEKYLLWASTQDGVSHYRLPEVMRAFCLERMRERPYLQGIRQRHAAYYAEALPRPGSESNDLALDEIATFSNQIGNFRAALEWSFSEDGDHALGVAIAAATAPYWIRLSLLSECRRWCDVSLAMKGSFELSPATEIALLEGFGIATLFTIGNGSHVLEAIKRGLALAELWEAPKRHLNFLAGLHIYLTRVGDFEGALDVARQSIGLAAINADAAARIAVEWMMGVSLHLVGDQSEAIRYCEAGLRQATALGAREVDLFGYDHKLRALIVLARSLWLSGSPDRASAVASEASEAIETSGRQRNPVNLCIALVYTSTVLLWRSDLAEADMLISRLIGHAHQNRLTPYEAVGKALRGELRVKRGQLDPGIEDLRAALAAMRSDRHNLMIPTTLRALAEAYLALGSVDEAHSVVEAALIDVAGRGRSMEYPELLRVQGRVRFQRGDLAGSRLSLLESMKVARTQGSLGFELRAAIELAEIERDSGCYEAGLAVLKPIYDRYTEGFETSDLQRAKSVLVALEDGA